MAAFPHLACLNSAVCIALKRTAHTPAGLRLRLRPTANCCHHSSYANKDLSPGMFALSGMPLALQSCMSTEAHRIIKEIERESPNHPAVGIHTEAHTLQRYAWLEQENGTWHLLTSPFADLHASVRHWLDEQQALQELQQEGWSVVHAYAAPLSRDSAGSLNGYGLQRTVH